MKLSKLFHTLYATVMTLPVLIIPIFALNILHKETEPISIEVQEKISVDFNQLFDYTKVSNSEHLGVYQTRTENGVITYTSNDLEGTNPLFTLLNADNKITTYVGHKYYFKGVSPETRWTIQLKVQGYDTYSEYVYEDKIVQYQYTNMRLNYRAFNLQVGTQFEFNKIFQIYDLTQMFGEGNEPTITEFNAMFPNQYYEYTLSQKMLVNKPTTTTFNSTDIGSQFIYALYKPVHDYFNFGEFFGLGGMYDWFQLNIFNGTAPLSFFIVFNVMIYWLFISLFWLLFDILIYVPMVIHKWLDKAEM